MKPKFAAPPLYRTKLFFPPVNNVLTTLPNYRYCILRSLITTGSF